MFEKEKTFGDMIAGILFKAASDSVSKNAERVFFNMKKKILSWVCGAALLGIGLVIFLAGIVKYLATLVGMPYSLLLVGAIMSVIGASLLR